MRKKRFHNFSVVSFAELGKQDRSAGHRYSSDCETLSDNFHSGNVSQHFFVHHLYNFVVSPGLHGQTSPIRINAAHAFRGQAQPPSALRRTDHDSFGSRHFGS